MATFTIDGVDYEIEKFNETQANLYRELQHAHRIKEDASYTMVVMNMRVSMLAKGIVDNADKDEDNDLVDDVVD